MFKSKNLSKLKIPSKRQTNRELNFERLLNLNKQSHKHMENGQFTMEA